MSDLVPIDWKITELNKLVISHNSGIYKKSDLYGSGTNILGVSQLYRCDFVKGQEFRKVPLSEDEIAKFTLTYGDLVYGESSLVRSGIAKTVCVTLEGEGTAFAWHTRRFSVDRSLVHPEFLNYFMSGASVRNYLERVCTQTAMTGITTGDYFKTPISFPPLPEQKKIASILTSVDDVIENTQRQIDKLQDLKKATMNELLTKGIGHTEFKDSELGRIPKSWEVANIGDVCTFVTSGSRGWSQYYSENGPIFIRIGNLTRDNINFKFDNIVRVSPPQGGEGTRTKVKCGDILVSITADLGVIAVMNKDLGDAYVNQHVCLARLDDVSALNARWVGHYLSSNHGQDQFTKKNDSGAKAGLNLPTIRSINFPTPPQNEQNKITDIIDQFDTDLFKQKQKLSQTQSLKKSLMQDLLTGKVRVTVD